jgi:hypothetical protein
VLKKFNLAHIGRKIPVKDLKDSSSIREKNIAETTTERYFWNDEKLMVVSSQNCLPKIAKVL